MVCQHTVVTAVTAAGRGLHSGLPVRITIHPAPPGTGIVFRRTDLGRPVKVPARVDSVACTDLCTTLERGEARIATVEHLLSALCGLEIDNALIDISGSEVPIMDGSAGHFVFLLESAGRLPQPEAPRRFIRILREVRVVEGDKWAALQPADAGFRLSFSIQFDHPSVHALTRQMDVDLSVTTYVREIARARTFGFLDDLDGLQARGKALGASVRNAVVLSGDGVVNDEGLRFGDELVRHKLLDAIGDLYLLGNPLIGGYAAHKAGHALNNRLLRRLLEEPSAWEWATYDRADDPFIESLPERKTSATAT